MLKAMVKDPPIVSVYWLSSNSITASVDVDPHGIVVDAAPVLRKFVGQPFAMVVQWMQAQGGFQMELVSGSGVGGE